MKREEMRDVRMQKRQGVRVREEIKVGERERDFHSWINKCRGEAFVLLKKMQREEPWLFSA